MLSESERIKINAELAQAFGNHCEDLEGEDSEPTLVFRRVALEAA